MPAMTMKFFRQNTKIIIWVTVAALALLFGAGSIVDLVSNKKEGRYAGEMFGKPVSFQEYNKFYSATQLFMPVKDKSEMENPAVVRTFTWQNIVYAREAKRLGINVSDNEVRQEIASILTQQGVSTASPEQYQIWVTRTLRMSPREFEEGLREIMRIQKLLHKQFENSKSELAKTPPADPKKAAEELQQKQRAAFVQWTNELNQRAAFKDYLTLPEDTQEAPAFDDRKDSSEPAESQPGSAS